eukprot:GHVO01065967.1.p1 GENE.GHVO01065967.1~~GHVO01065967.1.p1  ORF type:complete len:146 (+),score=36.68 GHVO01065967.1:22-438(+)
MTKPVDFTDRAIEAVQSNVYKVLQEREDAVDEELERLNRLEEDDIRVIRNRRVQEMKDRRDKENKWTEKGHGQYIEVFSDAEFFEAAKKSERVVAHFYRPTTWRCQIVDKHLETIARSHVETKFMKVNVEKVPFVADS